MRRLLAILALAVSLPIVVVLGTGAGDGGSGYKVRAVFDNVASAVPGEDVKAAGAKIGVIESMDVTPDNKAAVTLRIDDARFAPFRGDARCTVRPQSLIGEKFVECQPGTSRSAPLGKIRHGDGEGQHLLPVSRTSSPVDLDLVNDILRRPFRERLAILVNEFGTGLAGRGHDLNEVIHRANPALRETDRVLGILSTQNRVLANLARDSDHALAPLAREKRAVSGFVVQANRTAEATAERRSDIERGIQRLPGFLRQLRPLMADLGGFAGQASPVMRDLGAAAPDLSRLIRELGPFSEAAQPAITSLGAAAETGRPALIRTRPLIRDLASFGNSARPLSVNLDRLTASLDRTGGIERLMDFLFYSTTAVNGFDSFGHYLRAALLVNLCSSFYTEPAGGCNANFTTTRAIGAASSSQLSPNHDATVAALRGQKPGSDTRVQGGSSAGSVPAPPGAVDRGGSSPEGRRNIARIRRQAAAPSPSLKGVREPMLEYLLGSDGG